MENISLQPIEVGGQTFKNRIMFPPLTTGYEKNGMISEQDMGFYTRLAKGGVGYIVLGDVAPINSFSPTPKLFDDSQIPAFKALADSVHAYGTKLGVQLFHPEYDVDAINSLFMPGAKEGLSFFLVPDFGRMKEVGVVNTLVSAMNQAFFTLSLGIGAMSIFGSYIGKERSLLGESVRIVVLDTFVAITAGLIIFPACFTYHVDQTSGPSLIFITLPNIFANMALGRLWGSLFFLFMAFAALSTVLAVFENIICCGMELTGWNRQKSSLVNFFLIIALSLPCVLGYNVWAWDGFAIFGGAVLDVEDFLVSNLFLPLGSLVYLLFCVTRWGWGWDNYKKEVNTGDGLRMHDWMRGYLTYGLPLIVLFIFVFGLYDKFIA